MKKYIMEEWFRGKQIQYLVFETENLEEAIKFCDEKQKIIDSSIELGDSADAYGNMFVTATKLVNGQWNIKK